MSNKAVSVMNQIAGMFSQEDKPKPISKDTAKKAKKDIEKTIGYDESKDYDKKLRKSLGLE